MFVFMTFLFNTPEYGKFKIPHVIYVFNFEMNLGNETNERIVRKYFS